MRVSACASECVCVCVCVYARACHSTEMIAGNVDMITWSQNNFESDFWHKARAAVQKTSNLYFICGSIYFMQIMHGCIRHCVQCASE